MSSRAGGSAARHGAASRRRGPHTRDGEHRAQAHARHSPAATSARRARQQASVSDPGADNVWVPASVHPEASPAEFKLFVSTQSERTLQRGRELNDDSPISGDADLTPNTGLARKPSRRAAAAVGPTGELDPALTDLIRKKSQSHDPCLRADLITRSTSLPRRASQLHKELDAVQDARQSAPPSYPAQPPAQPSQRSQADVSLLSPSDLDKLGEITEQASRSKDPVTLRHALQRTISLSSHSVAFDRVDDIPPEAGTQQSSTLDAKSLPPPPIWPESSSRDASPCRQTPTCFPSFPSIGDSEDQSFPRPTRENAPESVSAPAGEFDVSSSSPPTAGWSDGAIPEDVKVDQKDPDPLGSSFTEEPRLAPSEHIATANISQPEPGVPFKAPRPTRHIPVITPDPRNPRDRGGGKEQRAHCLHALEHTGQKHEASPILASTPVESVSKLVSTDEKEVVDVLPIISADHGCTAARSDPPVLEHSKSLPPPDQPFPTPHSSAEATKLSRSRSSTKATSRPVRPLGNAILASSLSKRKSRYSISSWFSTRKEDDEAMTKRQVKTERNKKEELKASLMGGDATGSESALWSSGAGFFTSFFGKKRAEAHPNESDTLTSSPEGMSNPPDPTQGGSTSDPAVTRPHLDTHPPRRTADCYTRFPIAMERAIYRLGHLKLAYPHRSLREQVLITNLMLGIINLTANNPAPVVGEDKAQNQHPVIQPYHPFINTGPNTGPSIDLSIEPGPHIGQGPARHSWMGTIGSAQADIASNGYVVASAQPRCTPQVLSSPLEESIGTHKDEGAQGQFHIPVEAVERHSFSPVCLEETKGRSAFPPRSKSISAIEVEASAQPKRWGFSRTRDVYA